MVETIAFGSVGDTVQTLQSIEATVSVSGRCHKAWIKAGFHPS